MELSLNQNITRYVAFWHIHVTNVEVEMQQCIHSVCVVELHVTINYIKTLSVAQQRFCGKSMSPAKIKWT